MADTDSDQLHEVSDAELESMISSKNDDESDLNSLPSSLGDDDDDDDDMDSVSMSQVSNDGMDSVSMSPVSDDDDDDDDDNDNDNDSLDDGSKSIDSPVQMSSSSLVDSDDDSDDEALDNKFEIEGLNEFLANYHPESKQHNYDEIYALSKVVRDSSGIIIDDLHRTLPIMSKYEKTRILGQRAKQLNSGNKPFIVVPKNIMDGYLIAQEELMQKKLPFIIRRPLPNGGSEYWRIKDLEILY